LFCRICENTFYLSCFRLILHAMLQLQTISLTQFKNYRQQQFSFTKKVVGIYGNNGTGKTNLLDAIYYLCFTKSYFSNSDVQNVTQGTQGFRLSGNFLTDRKGDENHPLNVICILRENGRKEFNVNDELYTRVSKHIGQLPCVMIAPDDVELITGHSEERRRFMDALLCQLHSQYLQQLIEYNKILQQRNSLIKQFAEQNKTDHQLLDVINDQLAERGDYIFSVRNKMMQPFLEQAVAHYYKIAQQPEQVSLSYISQLQHSPSISLLNNTLQKDMMILRTTAGIHRDTIDMQLSGQPFKQIASQGPRKSLLFALKLTEFEVLQQHKGFAPIILLDDVFEKLDAGRMQNLLQEVCMEKGGQVFITDTHRQRLEENLNAIGADYEIVEI